MPHAYMLAKLLQSCLTLWNAMDCSPTGSSVYGILQARILEWVVMSSSKGSSWYKDQTWISYVSPALSRGFLPLTSTTLETLFMPHLLSKNLRFDDIITTLPMVRTCAQDNAVILSKCMKSRCDFSLFLVILFPTLGWNSFSSVQINCSVVSNSFLDK